MGKTDRSNIEAKEKICRYAENFLTGDDGNDRNILLKREHTLQVVRETRLILSHPETEQVKENPRLAELTERAALLHDLSRFEQFRLFRTFSDGDSFDHGERSAELAQEMGFLPEDEAERHIVTWAIRFHNKIALPPESSEDAVFAGKVVRDADKTDIFRVLLGYLANPDNPAVVWKLSGENTVSPRIEAALLCGQCPSNSDFRTALDFSVSKLGWVYDLNTAAAKQEFIRRNYLEKLCSFLPSGNPVIEKIYRKAAEFLRK